MLKLIACALMLIDHVGYFFSDFLPPDTMLLLRAAGRLAFPLFAYSVALGLYRTRHPLRYLGRMLLFAALTETIVQCTGQWAGFPFPPNVLITFSCAILVVVGIEWATRSWYECVATMKLLRSPAAIGCAPDATDYHVRIALGTTGLSPAVGLALGILAILAGLGACVWMQPDYGLYGLAQVVVFHHTAARLAVGEAQNDPAAARSLRKRTWVGLAIVNLLYFPVRILVQHIALEWVLLQLLSLLAVPLLFLPLPDRRPRPVAKYAFYLFYPLHISLLMWIAAALH